MKMKRLLWGFLMIAAVALTGCGSDGGPGLMYMGERVTQAIIDGLGEDLATATGNATDLQGQLDTATANATDLQGQLDTATANATDLQGQLDAEELKATGLQTQLDDATTNAMNLQTQLDDATTDAADLQTQLDAEELKATNLQTQLDTATGNATGLQTRLDAEELKVTDLQGQLDAEELKATGLQTKLEEAMATIASLRMPEPSDLAKAHEMAIVLPKKNGDPGNLGDSRRPVKKDNVVITTVAGDIDEAPSTTVKTDNSFVDTLNKDDKQGVLPNAKSYPNQLTKDDSATPAAISSFEGSVHTRTIKNVTDTLTIYTDLEDPKAVKYDVYYGLNAKNVRKGVAETLAAGVLRLKTGESSLFSGAGFPTGPSSILHTTSTDDDKTTENETNFDGMFNGVSGVFTCTVSRCTVENDAKGKMTTLTGGSLTFKPDADDRDTISIPGVNYDSDYMSFGYWVQTTTKDDGTVTYGVSTFATGSEVFTSKMEQLEGTATYSGKSTGMFVKETGPINSAVPTSSGQFTADSELMASFGGGDVAVNQQYTITGNVSNFMDANGDSIDSAWKVEFDRSEAIAKNYFENGANGATTGGGMWNATFYGNPAKDNDSNTKNDYPSHVVGEYNAHFDNGSVIGAYGASR